MRASAEAIRRREVLRILGTAAIGAFLAGDATAVAPARRAGGAPERRPEATRSATLFLCGDVMTGRGVDQILPHPSDPRIHEGFMRSARGYVELAEEANGDIPRPVDFDYVWGDALGELERVGPDARIVNLETAITRSDDFWPAKGIHYRMHPDNTPCLSAAGIDCCALANNHVLDWGYAGLEETLAALDAAGIAHAGAGINLDAATAPAVVELPGDRRVVVFAFGSATSGIPRAWAARADAAGVDLLADLSPRELHRIAARVHAVKRAGDVVVASIHWGSNWGYEIPDAQRRFAHALVDEAGVDIVHGHSSHHVKGIEVHAGKAILYGCGDFLTDYEGIEGYEPFRDDLGLMYFATVDPARGEIVRLAMTPTRLEKLRINRAPASDARWLAELLNREGRRLGTGVTLNADGTLELLW